jgi:hypothetical protein
MLKYSPLQNSHFYIQHSPLHLVPNNPNLSPNQSHMRQVNFGGFGTIASFFPAISPHRTTKAAEPLNICSQPSLFHVARCIAPKYL